MTSFIRTLTMAMTRSADLVTMRDVSWLATGPGTLRAVASAHSDGEDRQPALCISGLSGRLCLGRHGVSDAHELTLSGAQPVNLVGAAWPLADQRTIAAVWDTGELGLWEPTSGLVVSAAIAPVPAMQAELGTNTTRFLVDGALIPLRTGG